MANQEINKSQDDDEQWDDEQDYAESDEYFESVAAEVREECYMASITGRIADFAPLHVVLQLIARAVKAIGLDPGDAEGRRVFLAVCKDIIPYNNIMEHNRWLACFYCANEVLPAVDERFVDRFWQLQTHRIKLPEFYRCPDCGAPFSALETRREFDRHLPWYHYEHGDDFNVHDDNKPKT